MNKKKIIPSSAGIVEKVKNGWNITKI